MSLQKQQKPYRDAIEAELTAVGIRKWRYETGGRHMKCFFTLPNGKEHSIAFPCSPSDHRGAKNKSSEVRHMLHKLGFNSLEKRK